MIFFYIVPTILILGFLIFLVGYNFSFIFFRDNLTFKKKKSYLEFLIYNFGIGLGVYVFYAYCVLLVLPFSIYTILFPIIIFNAACFIKFRKNGDYIEPFQKKTIIEYFSSNKNFIWKRFVFLTISFVILFYKIYPALFIDRILPTSDPYTWGSKLYQLVKYGTLDYELVGAYVASILVVSGYFSFLSVDGLAIYSICKFFPVFILFVDLLLVVCIIDRIVGPISWSPLFLPFAFLYQNVFIYRAIIFVPTFITNFFVCVLFLSFMIDDVPLFMISLFIGNIIISHPFNGTIISILISGILILYYLFKKDKNEVAEKVTVNALEQAKEREVDKIGETNVTQNIRIKYVKDPLFLQGLSFKTKILRVIIMVSLIGLIILPPISHLNIYLTPDWLGYFIHYLEPRSGGLNLVYFIENDILKSTVSKLSASLLCTIVTPKVTFKLKDLMFIFTLTGLVVPTKFAIGKQQKMVVSFSKIFSLCTGLMLISYRIIGLYVLQEGSSIYNILYTSVINQGYYYLRIYELTFVPFTVLLITGIISLITYITDYLAKKVKNKGKSNEDRQAWNANVKNTVVVLFLAFFMVCPTSYYTVAITYHELGAYESFTVCYGIVQDSETCLNVGYNNGVGYQVKFMRHDANFIRIDQLFNGSLTLFKDYLDVNQIDYLWLFFNDAAQTTDPDPDYIFITQNMGSIGKVLYNDTNYFVIEVF